MNDCPLCHERAGVYHEQMEDVHILTCPICGFRTMAYSISDAMRLWNGRSKGKVFQFSGPPSEVKSGD